MNEDEAIVAEAEDVVRGIFSDTELQLDACEIQLRLASEQLKLAAYKAQDALAALYEAAEPYARLWAEARRQVAALGLSAARWPDSAATPLESGVADDVLILRGTAYAGHSPAELLIRTAGYVLNETAKLPAGTRIELRVHGLGKESR